MIVSIVELIVRARIEVDRVGHAPSTDSQYRWAWSQFELFCSREGIAGFTEDVAASFLEAVAADYREGRIKEWKRRLLRKAVLVLSEVAATGSYRWGVSRRTHPNDGLDATFRRCRRSSKRGCRQEGLLRLRSSCIRWCRGGCWHVSPSAVWLTFGRCRARMCRRLSRFWPGGIGPRA